MIELPEAMILAGQMSETLIGKEFAAAEVAADRPKFLFVTPEPPDLPARIAGRKIVGITSMGKWIFSELDDGETLLIGEFGGRLHLHAPGTALPKKRHVTFRFDDDAHLTLAIQMWGFLGILTPEEVAAHPYAGTLGPSPIDDAFTLTSWNRTLDTYVEVENKPIKAFLTHETNICGVGNGYLQDILFRARLSPKRKVGSLTADDRTSLYHALRDTLEEAIDLEGRDTERTLFGEPGGYVPILDKRAKGAPCPACGAPIEKIQYLGGSCYVCPNCQS